MESSDMNLSVLVDNEVQMSLNSTMKEPSELYQVPLALVIALACCYGLISLVSVVGNFCVLFIVALSRRMRTVTNFFIANLAVADIVIGLFAVPFQFQAALLQRWVLPEFLCAFCPFIQVLSVNVSVFSLAAIALDRYRAVMHPLRAKVAQKQGGAKWTIVAIWVVGAVIGAPYAVALRVTLVYDPETGRLSRPFCHNVVVPRDIWKVYNYTLVCLQYLVPLCLITMVYLNIAMKLKETKTPGNKEGARDSAIQKNRTKVIHMLYIVVALFTFCWLPLQLYNICQEIVPEINRYKYINVIWFCCHWLAMSNSCYNPFIYAIYNERFNSEFKNRFGCCLHFFHIQTREQKSMDSSSSRYA